MPRANGGHPSALGPIPAPDKHYLAYYLTAGYEAYRYLRNCYRGAIEVFQTLTAIWQLGQKAGGPRT